MTQNFTVLEGADILQASRTFLNDTIATVMSQHSGASFPTGVHLIVGTPFWNTNTNKLFILGSTGPNVWIDIQATTNDTAVPPGMINMWSGDLGSIPTGWQLCNGTGSTAIGPIPDLRSKFIVGADSDSGGTDPIDSTGGSESTTGSVTVDPTTLNNDQIPGHRHETIADDNGNVGPGNKFPGTDDVYNIGSTGTGGADGGGTMHRYLSSKKMYSTTTTAPSHVGGGSHTHSGSISGGDNRPPYYALAYIIKL